jgi:hypothetical protein
MGQEYDWQIRPGWLIRQQGQQRIQIDPAQCFIGNDGKTCAGNDFLAHTSQVVGDERRKTCLLQNHQRNLAIPAAGGEDNRAF